MDERVQRIEEAAQYIRLRIGEMQPEVGIVLGSGLGKLAEQIEATAVIPYSDIPNFVQSTALGHKGNFIFGYLSGKFVCAMQGRFHYYEGYSMEQVTLPIRVMSLLGVKCLFVSNACGGLNPEYKVGDLMIIKDHINLLPNPLIGKNMDEFGTRFPDLTVAYDLDLIEKAETVAAALGFELRKGVYIANSGPSYETPAEVRFYSLIGADAVGMSTVPEVIVGRHCGMRVFGMSVVTNISNSTNKLENLNDGDDVVRIADQAATRMSLIFSKLIEIL
ncbi:MAG: purine-nucleoside phosphorylase [Bacteroidales bacterium]|nr:purine-nucleoside phosphorylase [Candidatus Cacconaster merdequi]